MDFIDDPQFGHTKFRLPMILPCDNVCGCDFGYCSIEAFYRFRCGSSPADCSSLGTGEYERRPRHSFQDPRRSQVGTRGILVVFMRSFCRTTFLRRISQGYWFFARKSRDYRNSQHRAVQLQAFLARRPLRRIAFKPLNSALTRRENPGLQSDEFCRGT